MSASFRHVAYKMLGLLCPGCHQPERGGGLCSVCQMHPSPIAQPCPMCGSPNSFNVLCGRCQKKAPLWNSATMEWHFEGLTRHLIHQLKYHRDISAGRALARLWLESNHAISLPETLVPVPMFHRKEYKRGYNPSVWFAKYLSRHLDIPVWKSVQRIKATEPLAGMTKQRRQQELKGCFQLSATPPRSVAIVDDVYTSGTTATELARLLKRHGTKEVHIWALARTPLSKFDR